MTRTLRLFEGIGIELGSVFRGSEADPLPRSAGPSPNSAERFARGPNPA